MPGAKRAGRGMAVCGVIDTVQNPRTGGEVSRALNHVLESPEFARAERLRALLRFIVSHSVETNGARLKAYTIARQVFGRDETFDPSTDAVVRVEVGRLRQRLKSYYQTTGLQDELEIQIPTGSYVATFQERRVPSPERRTQPISGDQTASSAREAPHDSRLRLTVAVLGVLAVGTMAWLFRPAPEHEPVPVEPVDSRPAGSQIERMVAAAPVDHETGVLYGEALHLIFAPTETAKLLAARALLHRVTERAPSFGGGYAGESLTHSLAVIFGSSKSPSHDLRAAVESAELGIEKHAGFGLGHAMLGLALVLEGDAALGLRHCRNAVALQPDNAFSHWALGVSLLLLGRPADGIPPLEEAIRLDPVAPRTPYRNVLGIGLIASGQFERAVDVLERNLRAGGPDGPHMSVIRAAAYSRLGREAAARVELDKLRRVPREFQAERWLRLWLGSGAEYLTMVEELRRLGLPSDEGPQ